MKRAFLWLLQILVALGIGGSLLELTYMLSVYR